mgnify:CR=1 FL=1
MAKIERLAAWMKDVARRTERVNATGGRTAQRSLVTPTEMFGIEDYTVVVRGFASGDPLLVGGGMGRVGEYIL